jgi:alpha-L-fucosidase
MKKKLLLIIYIGLLSISLYSTAQDNRSFTNSRSEIQKEFLKWRFGAFFHFNMGTFADREWATGYEDPLLFKPGKLNCNQWIKAIKSAGMNYAVLTAKHTGGWCLWNSKYTTHDMEAFKNYKNGKGDIVREFVNACRKNNVKVGLYYCLPGDYSVATGNKEDIKRGYKITKDQEDLHGLPPEAKGNYEAFVEKQITELLTNYGKIDYMFFDQYYNKYTYKYWQNLKTLVHKLQPQCVINANNSHNFAETDVMSFEYAYFKKFDMKRALPPKGNTLPSEICDCITGDTWFWHNDSSDNFQNPDSIAERLNLLKGRNCNYLLNVQPSKNGIIEKEFIHELKKIKKSISANKN